MSSWSDCIVVLVDLIGLRKRALKGDSSASVLMRSFHKVIRREMTSGQSGLDHAYVWNDSVLLLAYVDDRPERYERAIYSADTLKRKIDEIAPSYAIAVKGRVFPSNTGIDGTRVTVIRASSYAMANCFEIEAQAKGKKRRDAWYIDVRIARKLPRARASEWITVVLRKNSMDDIDPSFECSAFAVCTLVFHSSGPRREVASSSTQSSSV